jgi:hypothetical protein
MWGLLSGFMRIDRICFRDYCEAYPWYPSQKDDSSPFIFSDNMPLSPLEKAVIIMSVAVTQTFHGVTTHDFFLLLSIMLLVSGASDFTMLALSHTVLRQVYRFTNMCETNV